MSIINITNSKPPLIPGSANFDTLFARYLKSDTITDGTATLSGGTLSSLNDPVNNRDAANKQYVDESAGGDPGATRSWKNPVNAASTTNVGTLSGLLNINNVQLEEDDRVLLKDQTDTTENGIYLVQSGAWVRSIDCATTSQATGATVYVMAGTSGSVSNAGKVYVCETTGAGPNYNPVNFGSAIEFVEFGGSSAGGSDTQVQFNNSGSLDGSSSLVWTGTSLNASKIQSNDIQSLNTLSDAELFTDHGSQIIIGATTSSNLYTNVRGRGGAITIEKETLLKIGDITIVGSSTTTAGLTPAAVIITSGTSLAPAATNGGAMTLTSGAGNAAGAGGAFSLTAGAGGSTGNGGTVSITGGAGGSTSGNGSSINITAGSSPTLGSGGSIVFTAGSGPTANGNVQVSSTVNSTSNTTGSMVVYGGAGIVKDLYVGGEIHGSTIFGSIGGLALNNIFIGTAGSVAKSAVVTGDATAAASGSFAIWTLKPSGVVAGFFQNANVTVNAKGLITSISTGTGSSISLTQNYMLIGNGSNIAQGAPMTGDASLSFVGSSASLSLSNTGVVAGTYNFSTIVVGADGRLTSASSGSVTGASTALTTNHIFVGDGSNVAADVEMTGDATIVSSGVLTLTPTGVTQGSYVSGNFTVGIDGRITAASNGSGGGGTPSLPLNSVQFNNNTTFGGVSQWSSDGNLLFGGTEGAESTQSGALQISGGASIGQDLYIGNEVYATAYNTFSDYRLKDNVNEITFNALNVLSKVKSYTYTMKDKKQIGLVAQQLEEIPELKENNVITGTESEKSVNYIAMIPILIKAMNELRSEIRKNSLYSLI